MLDGLPPHPISSPGRLSLQQLSSKVAVLAPEIRRLSSSINLSLPDVLSLAKHRRRNELVAVLASDQLSRLEEDGSAVDEGGVLPVLLGLQSGLDSRRDLLLGGHGVVCEVRAMFRGQRLVPRLGDALCLAVVEDLALHGELAAQLDQGFLDLCPLGGSSCVFRLLPVSKSPLIIFLYVR